MITLKIIKANSPVCDIENSNSVSSVSGKLTTLGLFFVGKLLNKNENCALCFLKEEITLKHWKTVRSSDPIVNLHSSDLPFLKGGGSEFWLPPPEGGEYERFLKRCGSMVHGQVLLKEGVDIFLT